MTHVPDVSFTIPLTKESASEINRLTNAFFSARQWAKLWKIWAKRYRDRYDAQYASDGEYQKTLRTHITLLKQALKEIADEKRPGYWCFVCDKWTEAKYSGGCEWCPTCKKDLYASNIDQRYEAIARNALDSIQ